MFSTLVSYSIYYLHLYALRYSTVKSGRSIGIVNLDFRFFSSTFHSNLGRLQIA